MQSMETTETGLQRDHLVTPVDKMTRLYTSSFQPGLRPLPASLYDGQDASLRNVSCFLGVPELRLKSHMLGRSQPVGNSYKAGKIPFHFPCP